MNWQQLLSGQLTYDVCNSAHNRLVFSELTWQYQPALVRYHYMIDKMNGGLQIYNFMIQLLL